MLTVLACSEGNHFVPADAAELPRLLATTGALVWVDLEAPSPDEVRVLSEVFHFHSLTIDDCLNERVDPPKVDDYGEYLFMVVQGIDFQVGMEMAEVTASELSQYVGRPNVVTFHKRPLDAVAETRERCRRAAPLPACGADWLAHAVLDTLVDKLLPLVDRIDEEIADMEDEALHRPGPALVERMTSLKRSVLRMRRLVAPQREVINRLSRGDFSHLVRYETFMYYRDIYDHLVRPEDMVEGLRDPGDSVISTYLATVNNRMNEIMKALSIVGTIFLPLTLLASMFGTNFAPTYEDWGWPGFAMMCAVMLASSVAAVWWFGRRRWL